MIKKNTDDKSAVSKEEEANGSFIKVQYFFTFIILTVKKYLRINTK